MKLNVTKDVTDYWLNITSNSGARCAIRVETRGNIAGRLLEEASLSPEQEVGLVPSVESILNEIEEVIHVSKMGGSSHTLVSRLTAIVNNHRSSKSVGD